MAKQPTIIKAPDGVDLIRTKPEYRLCGGCYLSPINNKCPHDTPLSDLRGLYWCTKITFGKIEYFIFKPAFNE